VSSFPSFVPSFSLPRSRARTINVRPAKERKILRLRAFHTQAVMRGEAYVRVQIRVQK
jgi:hypothetical protein